MTTDPSDPIEPGTCPDGIVCRLYADDILISETHVRGTDVAAMAGTLDAELAFARISDTVKITQVIYDGETGWPMSARLITARSQV